FCTHYTRCGNKACYRRQKSHRSSPCACCWEEACRDFNQKDPCLDSNMQICPQKTGPAKKNLTLVVPPNTP
ncbi:hypothetical protein LINGRAHAP2_LOCUS24307, partial [Linum grandiflorum]